MSQQGLTIGINGLGRIGKLVLRAAIERGSITIVGINDLASPQDLAHMIKYDTPHGRFGQEVVVEGNNLIIAGQVIPVTSERNPLDIPWSDNAQTVVESTGVFRNRSTDDKPGYDSHIQAGAGHVLLTVPAKDEIDATIVLGVNDDVLNAGHKCVSNASCTTNCLAPLAMVLDERFGILRGMMVTVHSPTNDQVVADQIHSDLRRARAANFNIIPTSTGAAQAVGKVLPGLEGKLKGDALRVSGTTGSVVDLTVLLESEPDVEEVNAALLEAAQGSLEGILGLTVDPIVSSDIIHDPRSSIVDGLSTLALSNMVKVRSWYDNEWGYTNRVIDLLVRINQLAG